MPPLEALKPHQTISRNAPITARYSLHTGRTQKQRSSRIVWAACGGMEGKGERIVSDPARETVF